MKNKLLIFLLIVGMVAFSTTGCRPQQAPPAPTETPEDTQEAREMEYEDGIYRGELERSERGWQPRVELVVENGEITKVDYDEYDEDNNRKSEDEEYNQRWEEASGTNALEAYPALEEQLIQVQDIEKVDVVSGATASTRDFKEVVAKALQGGPQEK